MVGARNIKGKRYECAIFIFSIFLLLPYLVAGVLSFSLWDTESASYMSWGSLDAYKHLFSAPRIEAMLEILSRSAIIALIDVFVSFFLAYLLIRWLDKGVKLLIFVLITIPLLIHPAIRGVSWWATWSKIELMLRTINIHISFNQEWATYIALFSSSLAFPIFTIAISLAIIHNNIWESCDDLGVRIGNEIYHVVFPSVIPSIIIGWIGAFSILLSSFSEIQYLAKSNISIPRIIFDLMGSSKITEIFALGTSLLLSYIILVIPLYIFFRRQS